LPRLTVVYDACVLYPAPLRDLLIRLGMAGLVQARWTDQILDEVFRNLLKKRSDLSPTRLARTRTLMNAAIRDVVVQDYAEIIESIELPDRDDRHVVAAAMRCEADCITTWNLRDFPATVMVELGIEVITPDELLCRLLVLKESATLSVVRSQAAALKSPPMTLLTLIDVLENNQLARFCEHVRTALHGGAKP
jgi:predicted nucleic acid-binding protein